MKTLLQKTDNCYFMPTGKGRIINGNICGLQMEEFLLEKVTTALPFKSKMNVTFKKSNEELNLNCFLTAWCVEWFTELNLKLEKLIFIIHRNDS